MTPPLTTVRQPAAEMGHHAAKAVLRLIESEPFESFAMTAQIQVRESVLRLN